jgi:hypothetical protein
VARVNPDGTVVVTRRRDGRDLTCEVLQTTEAGPPRLAEGERVLVWSAEGDGEEPVVLGRIGPRARPGARRLAAPEEIVLEAGGRLALRCGEGSVELRGDGKILVKGADLVSAARRTHRIKGGAVSIN